MVFKVTEQHSVGDEKATFSFNILSESDGVKIWLTDYSLKNGKKTLKRWSHFGDNGTFIKRSKIIIPESVIESVKLKIVNAIFLENIDK